MLCRGGGEESALVGDAAGQPLLRGRDEAHEEGLRLAAEQGGSSVAGYRRPGVTAVTTAVTGDSMVWFWWATRMERESLPTMMACSVAVQKSVMAVTA